MTRREVIQSGVATILLGGIEAFAQPVKSAIGAAQIKNVVSEDEEEKMYKEMFRALVCNVPQGETVRLYDPDITYIGPAFLRDRKWSKTGSTNTGYILIDFPNVSQLGVGSLGGCFRECQLIGVNLPSLQTVNGGENFMSSLCTEISLPSLTNFTSHEFSYSSTLKTLNLPSVVSKTGSYFVYHDSALEHVYLPKMTLADLGGASYLAQQQCNSAAVFHLKDGDYDYQGKPIT